MQLLIVYIVIRLSQDPPGTDECMRAIWTPDYRVPHLHGRWATHPPPEHHRPGATAVPAVPKGRITHGLETLLTEQWHEAMRMSETLTGRGVPTKTGKLNKWTHQAVARILSRA